MARWSSLAASCRESPLPALQLKRWLTLTPLPSVCALTPEPSDAPFLADRGRCRCNDALVAANRSDYTRATNRYSGRGEALFWKHPVDNFRVTERVERNELAVRVIGGDIGTLVCVAVAEVAVVKTTTRSPSAMKSCGWVLKLLLRNFPGTAPTACLPLWVPVSALSPRTVHTMESSMFSIAPAASPVLKSTCYTYSVDCLFSSALMTGSLLWFLG